MTDEVANLVRTYERKGLTTTNAIVAAVQFYLNQQRFDRDAQHTRIRRLEEKASGRDAE